MVFMNQRAAGSGCHLEENLILSAFCNDIVEDGLLNIHFSVFFIESGFIQVL